MTEFIYLWLDKLGFAHPLHAPITHVPMGMVIGGCLFVLLATFLAKPDFYRTALHCYVVALAVIPPAMFVGYMDWQHFYHGAWRVPIIAKLALAPVLFAVCAYVCVRLRRGAGDTRLTVLCALVSLALGGAIGYFGGELVYGG